jgi:2-aminoadipate transaminase
MEVLPLPELVKLASEVLETAPGEAFQYAPIGRHLGNPHLRAEIARFHGAEPDRIFVGNGSLQVLDLLAGHLLGGGGPSPVYVEAPTYDRAWRIFERHGGRVVGVPLEGDGVDVEALRALVSEQVPAFFYTIPDFQNPSGVCLSGEKRRALVALAEEFGFVIVEDTPYRRLRFHGADLPLLASLGGDRVVTIGSLSKILSPGLRVGYAIGTKALAISLAELAEDTYLTASPLSQAVAAKSFEHGLVDSTIRSVNTFLEPRHDAAVAAVAQVFGDDLLAVPGGGYFLGVLADCAVAEDEFMASARDAGVLLARGSAFYPGARPTPGRLFMRLPFQALTEDEFVAGVRRLAEVLQ